MLTLSKGNRKMNNGFLIFNLPAQKTCPGATAICKKNCYAKKAERMYPAVLPCRNENLKESKSEDFTIDMIQLIEKTVKGYKAFKSFFRIHESGDFYNQKYLDAWKAIAGRFPEIKFLAFTKSFNLDFSKCPKNLQIVFSIMPDTTCEPPKSYPKAYAGECGDKKAIHCPGNCDNCGMCWALSSLKKNVHFDMH